MRLHWRQRVSQMILSFTLVILLLIGSIQPILALAPEYLRNGECYMLIGEGIQKGVYRFNNPEVPKYFNPPKYLFLPDNSIGFSVDLQRNIYTFSEVVGATEILIPGNLKRQVLDGVTADLSDWGYHAYYHAEHRPWGRGGNIYRVGPAGRTIRRAPFKSNGPGNPIVTQPSSVLPAITGNTSLGAYGGKNWYSIPNGSWYSTWRQLDSWRGDRGYRVYGDKEMGIPHDWTLYTYNPDNVNLDTPNYTRTAGAVVAKSWDKRVVRRVFAGCIDGCGGASGSGSSVADPYFTDIAFMAPSPTNTARTYFYSRPEAKSIYSVSLNNSVYTGSTGNPLLGLPSDLSTKWIAISLRGANSDFVYCLGSEAIKSWYRTVTGGSSAGMDITAVTVSNQWHQKGGFVYAYDRNSKMLFTFDRIDDGSDNPLAIERYQVIPFSGILSDIGADPTSDIDDIKADGFGNLYFGISYPSLVSSSFDPTNNFTIDEAIYLDMEAPSPGDIMQSGYLIFKQDYGKYVFQRDFYSGVVSEIGHKTYATRYYNLHIRMDQAGFPELQALALPAQGRLLEPILASWSAEIGDNNGSLDSADFGAGSRGIYAHYTISDPGRVKLAVINIPTPPKVLSLGGHSLLDICGPYPLMPALPDNTNKNTNQRSNLLSPAPKYLDSNKSYFYMVENYPLGDGAQDPNTEPDWDGDGKMGGFISAMVDAHSSDDLSNPGQVYYEWRTWLVKDVTGKPVSPARLMASPSNGYPGNTGQNHYMHFYSPVPGSYIMTCRVTYNWYDYDNLAFGSTIDDLGSVLKSGVEAKPSTVGHLALTNGPAELTKLMNDPSSEFGFMLASASQYISQITPANNFAIMPIIATGTPINSSETIDIARAQRCDGTSINPGNDSSLDSHWFPLSSSSDLNPPDGYHGLVAGNEYWWRMDVASQTNFFFDISSSIQSTNPNASNYNYVAARLLDSSPNNPMYANGNPNFVFRNRLGDLNWKVDGNGNPRPIIVSAFLEYKVPNGTGGVKIVRKYLLGDEDHPEVNFAPTPANNPIICSTSGELPPTDPYDAELVITLKREFSRDMWSRSLDPMTGLWRWGGSPMTLDTWLIVEARTKVMIMDTEAPRLIYSKTTPINLFGVTGQLFGENVGPDGMKNPTDVKFTVADNNPWESVQGELGITNLATWNANSLHNQSMSGNSAPTAQYNHKPIFAKNINKFISLSFESAVKQLDKNFPETYGSTTVSLAGLDFSRSGKYALTDADSASGSYLVADFINATTQQGSDPNITYSSEVEYSMNLSKIMLGRDSSGAITRILPKGYANNSPGYYVNPVFDGNLLIGGEINPYKFYATLVDSSGNFVQDSTGNVKPQLLNMVLHVADDIPPNPFGMIHEHKIGSTKFFPVKFKDAMNDGLTPDLAASSTYSPRNLSDYVYNEDFIDRDTDWIADDSADGYINGTPLYFQSLMSLGDNVIKRFSDAKLTAQITNMVPPGYLEDNVECNIGTGVSDNAGAATSWLTFKYLDADGAEESRTVVSKWSRKDDNSLFELASMTSVLGIFRGRTGDFPMAIPVEIIAQDNARAWDYYLGDGGLSDANDNWSGWKWGTARIGRSDPNRRNFKTTIPVYGSKLIIRTLDKGLRNK